MPNGKVEHNKRELKLIRNSIKKMLVASRIRAVAELAFALIVSTALVAHAEDVVGVAKVGPTTNDVTTAQMPFTPMGESKFQNWQLRC